MLALYTIVLISCATLVLTSSVSKSQTDGSSKDDQRVSPVIKFHDNDDPPSSTVSTNKHAGESKNEENLSPIMAEGGPIYQSQSPDSSGYASPKESKEIVKSKELGQTRNETITDDYKSKLPKTRNASVVARKGVVPSSKITARKGVGPEILPLTKSTMVSVVAAAPQSTVADEKKHALPAQAVNDTVKSITEKASVSEGTNFHESANDTRNNTSDVSPNSKIVESTSVFVPTIPTKIAKNTTTTPSPPTRKFKAKPTVTIGEMDIDKPIPASPTKTPPLGMPRKIDYIVPVIITIMALPLLGGATFFLYRRGRDCWDKRHYRRMDFLIDGMYNDYSWK